MYDNTYINIVMEMVRGIPLTDYMNKKKGKRLPEGESQIIMRQILHAIKYLHARGVVHRDLKLENIMVLGTESGDLNDLRVKLIDFGMSKHTQKGKKVDLSTYCGTISFMAPEVLSEKDSYDQSCDIWSLGVMAYGLLSGDLPFRGRDDVAIKKNIMQCNYEFDGPVWDQVSEESMELIRELLVKNPQKRFTPEQALQHPWLSG